VSLSASGDAKAWGDEEGMMLASRNLEQDRPDTAEEGMMLASPTSEQQDGANPNLQQVLGQALNLEQEGRRCRRYLWWTRCRTVITRRERRIAAARARKCNRSRKCRHRRWIHRRRLYRRSRYRARCLRNPWAKKKFGGWIRHYCFRMARKYVK
jgi:hypothetical protein